MDFITFVFTTPMHAVVTSHCWPLVN